eukprot:TRINITY_DN6621_c0_g2_i1.p1 TRINITY_DN6621_c0_g2~~TRINITY_DN6621_c0_g2_i1.p1  ORF type:complete len:290 (+),score=49.83 TRINITY_DN6621_c0_g2_i1:86-955(+)
MAMAMSMSRSVSVKTQPFLLPRECLCSRDLSFVTKSSLGVSCRRLFSRSRRLFLVAFASSGFIESNNENPYEILGVNPLERFEKIKAAYTKQYNDAKRRGDNESMAQLERAYDSIMMQQLSNRKQGKTFGDFKVSKAIKYADRRPLFPWGPRYALSDKKIIACNLLCSIITVCWAAFSQTTNWKPLQFLIVYYFGQSFVKLRSREGSVSTEFMDAEEEERVLMKIGKVLLRALCLVFSCVIASSFAYTGSLNLIEYTQSYVPLFLVKGQELIVTASSAIALFFMASYFR